MLITSTMWDEIRSHFTPEEKALLNAAMTGEVICPRGVVLDEAMLPEALRGKLVGAVKA